MVLGVEEDGEENNNEFEGCHFGGCKLFFGIWLLFNS